MATASKVQLSTDVGDWPEYYRSGISQDQVNRTSELLQENHDNHHIFFNTGGLHNHIAHDLLAKWALNATTEDIQKSYEKNVTYQRQGPSVDESVLRDMGDSTEYKKHLGTGDNYHTLLKFFENEIDSFGWENALQKHVFAGDERADDMLVRMYAGFLHPIIHLGYGVEFRQPAIVAEALAQAACHEIWIGQLLLPAEKAAKEQSDKSSKSVVQLLDEIHDDKDMQNAADWGDGNKVRDGVLARAAEKMIQYAAQYHVKPEELEEKNAEMTNAVCYYTAGAQHPPNMVMYDFYFIHCVNSSIFFPAFNKLSFLSQANKVRLLEWKVRLDLAMYTSRKCPDIKFDEIRNYKPKQPSGWDGIMDRVTSFYDDGHAVKLVRALAHGQRICEKYEGKEEYRVKHEDWLQMGHMAIDSVEAAARFEDVPSWVRSAGFEEAWKEIPLRAQL
ncbi:hypothetical protein LTR37_016389 [Vermiconidia calcicola]|uniref:Uncharacterized protein n=1 Tax=Vermiconidia calcicola TaxID=1690605 RepID=A0ACC3MPI9_9PEZI|nr:hypothetical protein LTR37_016389 [Vermiconidia calcicola]